MPGPQSATLLANVLLDGEVADSNDVLFAFSANGNCVGSAPMVLEQGLAFVNLTIYGDDLTTDLNEGLVEGAPFFLAVFDASTEQTLWLNGGAAIGSWTNMNGAPLANWSNPYSNLEFVSAEPCPSDFDGSGAVEVGDLLDLLSQYGLACDECPQDINKDGFVDVNDLLDFLSSYGAICN
jgi:uncharacterized protein (DUF779 family)